MSVSNEITGGKLEKQCSCGKVLKLECYSNTEGCYLGYICPDCGPVGRETIYYRNMKLLRDAIYLNKVERR